MNNKINNKKTPQNKINQQQINYPKKLINKTTNKQQINKINEQQKNEPTTKQQINNKQQNK